MKVKERFLIILFALIFFVLILNVNSYAGTQKWNSLDYDATLNSDGSMDVIETWNIYVSNTNTLFKDFEKSVNNITGVKVSLIEDGDEKFLEQIHEEQYHVDNGCYYALKTSSGMFEIAWNVGLDNSSDTRTYKVYYTVKKAVTVYKDCAELYWQFLGDTNEISGKKVTGTIHLPSKVSDIEKLRVWAHGDLAGEIEKNSADTVSFSLSNLETETMLEVRVVTEENIYENCKNVSNVEKLDSILEEEQKWADEANTERLIGKMIIFIIVGINALVALLFTLKIKKSLKQRKQYKDSNCFENYDIEYFRDIPDEENATPARASCITSQIIEKNMQGAIFSATLLDLSLRNIIEFETLDKENIKIIIKNMDAAELIPEDERTIYLLIKKAAKGKSEISIEEFERFAKGHYETVMDDLNEISALAENYEVKAGKIDEERKKIAESARNTMITCIVILMFYVFIVITLPVLIIVPTIPIGIIVCAIVSFNNYRKISKLSESGYREKKEWLALKKYMEDYSLLKERDVPDIVLWEKYLVYATTFGISSKVLKNLKVVHPEMFDSNSEYAMMNSGYWHIVCSNQFDNGFDSLNDRLSSVYESSRRAYDAAHSSSSSSGSGGGGGFSGGGGGRWRRRRLRRSLNKFL